MKKAVLIVVSIITLLFINFNVSAKDTVYSLNKFEEEKFNFILDSYNEKKEKDGVVVGGDIFKGTANDIGDFSPLKTILVKYNYNGKVLWYFTYDENLTSTLNYLEYTYDDTGNIDGYLLVVSKSDSDKELSLGSSKKTTFVKVDLTGKFEWEKETLAQEDIVITKIISFMQEDAKYYIAIGTSTSDNKAVMIKYDRDLNPLWSKKYDHEGITSSEYIDIIPTIENKNVVGFALIRKLIKEDSNQIELVKHNLDGAEEFIINYDLNKKTSYNLVKNNAGIVLYGITPEVKLKKGNFSYYIVKFNLTGEEEWETIGEEALNTDKKIKLFPVEDNNEIIKYLFMYTSNSDTINTEVAEIDLDGLFVKKIKKIASDYYVVSDFSFNNNTLYFAGQINCPEDDNCEYDSRSLFLISDEDKVIEVEDNTSERILIATIVFIIIIGIGVFIGKKRKLKNL